MYAKTGSWVPDRKRSTHPSLIVCRRCEKELERESFRQLRKQYSGVCKACEAKELYERELRAQERRQEDRRRRAEALLEAARRSRLRVLPDDE